MTAAAYLIESPVRDGHLFSASGTVRESWRERAPGQAGERSTRWTRLTMLSPNSCSPSSACRFGFSTFKTPKPLTDLVLPNLKQTHVLEKLTHHADDLTD